MNQSNEPKIVIGRSEWCAFPTLDIPAIKARVDSGAKTSSLHAVNIKTFTRNSDQWVRFDVYPLQDDRDTLVHCEAQVITQRVIKSSNGEREKRFVIGIPMGLGDNAWPIEITLSDRDSMGYRMLLGREAMIGRVLIDPEGQCLLGEPTEDTLRGLYNEP